MTHLCFEPVAAWVPPRIGAGAFRGPPVGVLGKLPIVGSSLSNMGIDPSFSKQEDLIRLQLQIQQQTQTFSTISNINKAKHDAAMTAVRNFK